MVDDSSSQVQLADRHKSDLNLVRKFAIWSRTPKSGPMLVRALFGLELAGYPLSLQSQVTDCLVRSSHNLVSGLKLFANSNHYAHHSHNLSCGSSVVRSTNRVRFVWFLKSSKFSVVCVQLSNPQGTVHFLSRLMALFGLVSKKELQLQLLTTNRDSSCSSISIISLCLAEIQTNFLPVQVRG